MNIQTVTFGKTSFTVCTDPKELELKYLKHEFNFSPLHIEDYINKTQVPKIETVKNYTLVVLDFPYFFELGHATNGSVAQEKNMHAKLLSKIRTIKKIPEEVLAQLPITFTLPQYKRIATSQIDFFIGPDFLVVLHDGMLAPISDIFQLAQKTLRKREELMQQGPAFLFYRIVDVLVDSFFPVMSDISTSIESVDRALATGQSQGILEQISTTRRNIVYLHTMIKPILPLFRELEEGKHKGLNQELTPFWGNVLDHLQKVWDRLEDSRELIEGISESNESLLSSRTNRIITILTIFSAILLPLNLVASIYGMNIELPLASEPTAFMTIVILMIIVGSVLALIFKSRRWL